MYILLCIVHTRIKNHFQSNNGAREVKRGSFDGESIGAHNGAGIVQISNIFAEQDDFFKWGRRHLAEYTKASGVCTSIRFTWIRISTACI